MNNVVLQFSPLILWKKIGQPVTNCNRGISTVLDLESCLKMGFIERQSSDWSFYYKAYENVFKSFN